jgi:hypothetical protein
MYTVTNCICWSLKLYSDQGTLGNYRYLKTMSVHAYWSLKMYVNKEKKLDTVALNPL